MGKEYHTRSDNEPFSIFREFTCGQCNVVYHSNEALIGICSICNGDKDKLHNSLIACPKCGCLELLKKSCGNSEQDYCYYCKGCEDTIAKGAILK